MPGVPLAQRCDPPDAAPPLDAVRVLLEHLQAAGIRYCQWKNTEQLRAAMGGATALDLLVDRGAAATLGRVFADLGVKRLPARPFQAHPGIEDYVAFDPPTGTLAHVTAYYQLMVGEEPLKGYRLPWEELVLATRVVDEGRAIYVADPHVEVLLLAIRAALGLHTRDRLRALGGAVSLPEGVQREFRRLGARTDPDRLRDLAAGLVGAGAAAMLREMTSSPPPSTRQLLEFRRRLEPAMPAYRMYGAFEARQQRWRRALAHGWWRLRCRHAHIPARSGRDAPQGHVTIVLVGPEEAGTLPIAHRIADWLSWELAVVPPTSPRLARRARGLGHVTIIAGDAVAAFDAVPPDLVLELRLPRARRADAAVVPLRRQSDAVAGRRFPAGTRVVAVDGAQPPERVELLVKEAVWQTL